MSAFDSNMIMGTNNLLPIATFNDIEMRKKRRKKRRSIIKITIDIREVERVRVGENGPFNMIQQDIPSILVKT